MWYKVDFNKLPVSLMLVGVRKPAVLGFLWSFIKPLTTLHQLWQVMRLDNIYKLEHNAQVCYFRAALNDRFDPDLRRIYIDEGTTSNTTYIYTPGEHRPKYIGTIYLYQALEVEGGADFFVYVPSEILASQLYEIRALIDFYRLGGKRYLIVEI